MYRKVAALVLLFELSAPGFSGAQDIKAARVFSGNETRMYIMNFVNPDCSSGPRPDVRVVLQPANGTVRLEPVPHIVNVAANAARANCNGKRVDGVAVYYKSKEGFVGMDKMELDTDFKAGQVTHYIALIDVR